MRLKLTRGEAGALAVALVSARLVMTLVIDGGDLGNSSWMCVIGGFILNLPLAMATDMRRLSSDNDGAVWRGAWAIIALVCVYNAAASLQLLINIIAYSERARASAELTTIIILLVCLYAITKNGHGIGNSTKLWMLIFSLLFAISIVVQFPLLNTGWLTPIFGAGFGKLAEGTIAAAGCQSVAIIIHMAVSGENDTNHPSLKSLSIASALGLAIVLIRDMMSPVFVYETATRAREIDILISNGRQSLGLQFPLLVSTFSAFIINTAGYMFLGAYGIQRLLKKPGGFLCGAITAAIIFAICALSLAASEQLLIIRRYEFIITAIPVLILMICALREYRKRSAQA